MYVSYASISNYLLNFSDIQAQSICSWSPQKKHSRITHRCNTRPSGSYHNHVNVPILTLVSNFAFLSFIFYTKVATARVDGYVLGEGEALLHPPLPSVAGGTQRGRGSSSQGRVQAEVNGWEQGGLEPPLLLSTHRTQTDTGWLMPVKTGPLWSSAAWHLWIKDAVEKVTRINCQMGCLWLQGLE